MVCITLVVIGRASKVHTPALETLALGTPVSDYVAQLEIRSLQGQLEENRAYNDRTLQVVLWSIGGLVGVSGIVLGANLFNSYKASQQERESLRSTQENLQRLESSTKLLQRDMAIFIIDSAIDTALRDVASNDFSGAVSGLCHVCTQKNMESAGFESARQWISTVRGILENLEDQVQNGETLTIEPDRVGQLTSPVEMLRELYWGLPAQEVHEKIGLIQASVPEEDSLSEKSQSA
jgi:hypothetical protein